MRPPVHNGPTMQRLFVLTALIGFGAVANAQVTRCVDAVGNVSYTDQRCPANTRQAEQVLGPEATAPQPPPREAPRPATPFARDPAQATAPAPPPPVPSGPIVIDPRGTELAEQRQRDLERQRASEYPGDDAIYPYPAYRRPPARPRDMRPQIRNCDAGGCQDTQGNRYDNTGRLNSYRGLDGRTCQPVGTTVVCR
ncbi:MAG: DUF4124 domain-containing protein [Comamonadaceae bacterium]|nr:MAG: DUF4124 domain-containing protein [Comamonadaceae bacterium]